MCCVMFCRFCVNAFQDSPLCSNTLFTPQTTKPWNKNKQRRPRSLRCGENWLHTTTPHSLIANIFKSSTCHTGRQILSAGRGGVVLFTCYCSTSCAGIFKQSLGARNRVGIWLSYRPARLHRLAELILGIDSWAP